MHETSGQLTSGRVIAQQCTGMQSLHARMNFLVEGRTVLGVGSNSMIKLSVPLFLDTFLGMNFDSSHQ